MSDRQRYEPFRGFLASIERANKAGHLDITDMKAEARRKREAGETPSAWRRRMLKEIHGVDSIDHDREVENDDPMRNA